MKKFITLMMLMLSLFTLETVYADYDNAESQIVCENGKIVVSGAFENPTDAEKTYSVVLAEFDAEGKMIAMPVYQPSIAMTAGENTFSFECDIDKKEMNLKLYVLDEELAYVTDAIDETVTSLRVLAIGNSFSVDTMQWLYNIAEDGGIDNIVLGNMYIGNCTLEKHKTNAETDAEVYTYYKNTTGKWTNTTKQTLKTGIIDEDWDVITLQQQSGKSGVAESYDENLDYLIDYVNANKTNKDAELVWHMTWAYPSVYDPDHKEFVTYNSDQMTMYNAILNAVETKIMTNDAFSYYIPTGTAIQNARAAGIPDTELNRDTCHLGFTLGRYIGGLTWFHKITGLPIDDITYVPNKVDVPPSYMPTIIECVKNAILYPDRVTPSENIIEQKEFDLSNYTELEWTPTGNSYYNSYKSSELFTGDKTSVKYITSKIYTKEELPNGTLLVIDPGYMYKPEGWITLDAVNTVKPDNIMTNIVEITDEWWGDYNYRAFNVTVLYAGEDITEKVDEVASHFRIYLPK